MKKILIGILTFLILITTSLASAVQTGSSCSVTEDCPDLHDCTQNVCVHKPLFPITFREVIGTIIILTINALMTAGGVGAGSAYVPYIMLLFRTTLQRGIYIAYACVFGGGVGNLVNIITLKNPITKRYLTNYNVNMIVLPALMNGVLLGVVVSRIVAPFMVNVLLMMVLSYSVYKNYFKLKANLQKERKNKTKPTVTSPTASPTVASPTQFEEKVPTILSTPDLDFVKSQGNKKEANDGSPLGEEAGFPSISTTVFPSIVTLDKSPKIPQLQAKPSMAYLDENENQDESNKEIEKENPPSPKSQKRDLIMQKEQQFPFHKVRQMILILIVTVVIGLIRGSKRFAPVVGVKWSCGWDFSWLGVGVLANLCLLYRAIRSIHLWQKEKIEVGYEFLPEDPLLDKRKITKLAIGSTLAGMVGAIVALGGAMIVGPILLEMKIPPMFSASTTGVFMIFAMFSAMFQTTLDGRLSGIELAWFLPLSFLFSFASSKIVNRYVKKTGKQSTIILLIMLGASLGFICLLAISIQSLVEDFDRQMTFNAVC